MDRPGTRELELGPGLSLVHDPDVHCGKTTGMAKGLFLSVAGRLFAGESAGIGLPVLRTGASTVFPACTSVVCPDAQSMVKSFSMEKTLRWKRGEAHAPPLFARALERIAEAFMKIPFFQQRLLPLRSAVFALLGVNPSMAATEPQGSCLITYRASPQGLLVEVDGSRLEGRGKVIVLNEVEGSSFTRLRKERLTLEGRRIPAWQRGSFDCSLENPALGLSVSLAPGPGFDPGQYELFCGREKGWMLDWAGIALICAEPVFSYRVAFAREGTGGVPWGKDGSKNRRR